MRSYGAGLVLLAVCTLLGGCATRPGGSERAAALLSDAAPGAGRDCRLLPTAAQARSVDAVIDSAAVVAALAGVLPEGVRGRALFSLTFDQNGWAAGRHTIESTIPDSTAASVLALIGEHLRTHEAGEAWGTRLLVEVERGVRLRVGRQEHCEARLRPRRGQYELTNPFDIRSMEARPRALGDRIWISVDVDAGGAITGLRFDHVPSRFRDEVAISRWIRSLDFDPALLDGVPVAGSARLGVPAS